MRWLVIFLLLSTAAVAQNIADYPYFLFTEREFNAYIIKGDLRSDQEITAANLVINTLPSLYRPIFRIHDGYNFYRIRADPRTVSASVRLASQVPVLDKPAIIVGTPCNNEWARRVLKFENCNSIPADEGMVLLGTYNNQLVILITGGSPEMVLSAAQWLHSEAHFRAFARAVVIRRGMGIFVVGNGDLLTIGRPIGQVTPVVTVGVGSYLRFPGGRVVYGKPD